MEFAKCPFANNFEVKRKIIMKKKSKHSTKITLSGSNGSINLI